MENTWLNRWDERYRQEEYAYGILPNEFLKEQLAPLAAGKILFGAEGEGRNAVFAALQGWQVSAFDISKEGRDKALRLAAKRSVTLHYQLGELPGLGFGEAEFDAIALIYAHFPAAIKSQYHLLLNEYLKKGGYLIFEAFSKKHLAYKLKDERIGGPGDLESLFSKEEILSDFEGYDILLLEEKEIELSEGLYHNGKGSVIRFVGRKR